MRSVQPTDEDVVGLQPARRRQSEDLNRMGGRAVALGAVRADLELGLLECPQPEVGDGGHRPRELARGRLRCPRDVVGGELAELGQRTEPLHDVGLGGEQLLTAQPEALDQAVDVEVGPGRVQRRRGRPVELEEAVNPLARLGRNLRRLQRGGERTDHVELATAGDLGTAGDVDRAQLDRRPRERPHDGGGVTRIGEQPQPREQIADLRALKEGCLADEPVRDRALLQRDRQRLALDRDLGDEHRHLGRSDAVARDQPFDLDRDRLCLRAVVGTSPQLDLGRRARLAALIRAGSDRGDRVGPMQCGLRRAPDRRRAAAALGQRDGVCLRSDKTRHPLGAGAAIAPDRRRRVAGDGEVLGRQRERERRGGEIELLGVVDQQMIEAAPRGSLAARSAAQQRERIEQDVALVTRSGLVEQTLMDGVDLGELALDRGLLVQLVGPLPVGGRIHQLGLEPVDPAHERGQQRVGPPTEVVVAQRELVDAFEHQGEPVPGAQHGAGPLGAAQHELGQLGRRQHEQLLIAAGERHLEPRPQRSRPRRRRHEHDETLRRDPARHQPLKARGDDVRLSRTRDAVDDKPRAGVADGLSLGGREAEKQLPADLVAHL